MFYTKTKKDGWGFFFKLLLMIVVVSVFPLQARLSYDNVSHKSQKMVRDSMNLRRLSGVIKKYVLS